MIIDAHYHIEERIETVDRLLGQMQKHGISRVALMPALNAPVPTIRIFEMMGGIMQIALTGRWRMLHGLALRMYGLHVSSDDKISLLIKRYPVYNEPDNESTARIIQAHPDKFCGWIVVNPRLDDMMAEVDKRAGQPGWIGVKA